MPFDHRDRWQASWREFNVVVIFKTALIWLGLASGYLFLAGDVSEVELISSVICASIGAALSFGVSSNPYRRFAGWPPTRAVGRPLVSLIPEVCAVGRELAATVVSRRDRRGAFVLQPFDPGKDGDPVTAGRRAAVVLGLSCAPRTFVVRGEATDTLILHAMPKKAASFDRGWPT